MSAIVFLLLAVAIIVVGSVVVYLRQRTPSSLDSGIASFKREMEALAVRGGDDPSRDSREPREPREPGEARPARWKR